MTVDSWTREDRRARILQLDDGRERTANDWALKLGCSAKEARLELAILVRQGLFERNALHLGNSSISAYRRVGNGV